MPALSDLSGALDGDTFGAGVDAVLVTAATNSPTLADESLRLLRDRGRLIIVGDVPLHLDRTLMYRGELTVQVSRSYGPGRYDFDYEERGRDYPIGQVRWTEGRNFAAVLDLIQRKRLDVAPLITAVVPVAEAQRAYELASDRENQLAVLLAYESTRSDSHGTTPAPRLTLISPRTDRSQLRVALVGPGAFATSVLIPALRAIPEVAVSAVVARRPADARSGAVLLSANYCTGEIDEVLADPAVDALVIATQHDSHADLARRALLAGKHVFVEKPLGLSLDECAGVVDAATESGRLCMVDFNRRFSSHAQILRREILSLNSSTTLVYRVNAGRLPRDHWLLDPERGGGRILGEAVHFLDLLCWMFGAEPSEVVSDIHAVADPVNETVCTLVFPHGCSATLVYSTQGSADASKEWIEILGGGHTWTLDDFRRTRRDGKVLAKGKQSKGHEAALRHFVRAALGHSPLRVTAGDGMRATRLALEVQGRAIVP
jgi:predicted dehydrogenase